MNMPAGAERNLMALAFYLMLVIVIPVLYLTIWFARRFRASNTKVRHQEALEHTSLIEIVVWAVPAVLIFALGTLVWNQTHRLDPYRPLEGTGAAMVVQAVAQDWKWLFLYPDLGIASVNELAFPADAPLSLRITSDVAMNSLMIPALGGQIYAMAGMETRLNLKAAGEGEFQGRNMQYSGAGFADQTFRALAMSHASFEAWVEKVSNSTERLNEAAYAELTKQSIDHPVTYYAGFEKELFSKIIARHRAGPNGGSKDVSGD